MIENRNFYISTSKESNLYYACSWIKLATSHFIGITVPYHINQNDYEHKLALFIFNYIKKYGFDYEEFMKKYKLDYYEMSCLIFILHEIGHMSLGYKEFKRYGEMKTSPNERFRVDRISTKCRIAKDNKDWNRYFKIQRKYRELKGERFADKFTCDMLKVFGKELSDIVRGNIYYLEDLDLIANKTVDNL